MNCRELDSFALPYLDGELEPDAAGEIEGHLADCTACATRLHREAQFRQLLQAKVRQAAGERRAPDRLRSRVLGGLKAEQRRRQVWRWASAGAAAAAVIGIAGGSVAMLRSRELSRVIDFGALHHAQPLPLDVQDSSVGTANAWLSAHLDHRLRVPQLPNAVFRGLRVSNMVDKPAAYALYDVPVQSGDVKQVSLYVFDDAAHEVPAPRSVEVETRRGFNVALWREDEIVYEMVSDLNESDVRALLKAREDGSRTAWVQPAAPRPAPVPASFPVTPTVDLQPASFQR